MILTDTKEWGTTKDKEQVYRYTLKNEFLEVSILNYGGIIQEIRMPNRDNVFENIVLGFDDIKSYEERSPHFGAIVGRNAGRIKNGELLIKDKIYHLGKNNFNNNLHGYPDFYGNKIWEGKLEEFGEKGVLTLKRKSPHLESNFPGNVDFTVKYTLEKNVITLEYTGVPDRDTYINLTNHTYFNLSGDCKKDIGNQIITLNSNEYLKVDEETIPIKIEDVDNSVFDLRRGKKFQEVFESTDEQIKIVNNGFDHPFVLSKNNAKEIVASCYDEKSGRKLELKTTEPVIVLYTGNYLGEIGKISKDVVCKNHFGFCLETQDYPDATKFLPQRVILNGTNNKYHQKTSLVLSIF